LSAYLRGRTAVCIFQGAVLVGIKCHDGVPQGSVLSPHLFNFFVSDFLVPATVNESYADNFDLVRSSPNKETLGPSLTEDLKHVSQWSIANKLSISAAKSTITFFTPWNREVNFHPTVLYEGTPLPLAKNIKNLGLIISPLFGWTPCVNLMKAIQGQDWGGQGNPASHVPVSNQTCL
jgi:hypothetical protein